VEVRPFQSFFHTIAGTWWANGLFMLGLLAIGVALIAGVAMRIAAIFGVLMLAMMWLAEVPFAQFTSAGEPTGPPNPFADSHYTYAIVLIVLAATYAGTTWGLAATYAGTTWGLGATWARLPFVHHNH
jgi:thiosulfate dehydrogenase [quinone] large subunit